jgi:hypothetical protein
MTASQQGANEMRRLILLTVVTLGGTGLAYAIRSKLTKA